MEDVYEIWNTIKQGINEADGKITGKEKKTTKNSFSDEECQIILEDKGRAYNKMISRNTRQNEQEYKSERKEAIKIFRPKKKERESCINQIWSKWKLLILTMKQRNFMEK